MQCTEKVILERTRQICVDASKTFFKDLSSVFNLRLKIANNLFNSRLQLAKSTREYSFRVDQDRFIETLLDLGFSYILRADDPSKDVFSKEVQVQGLRCVVQVNRTSQGTLLCKFYATPQKYLPMSEFDSDEKSVNA